MRNAWPTMMMAVLMIVASQALADDVTLSDRNSTADFSTGTQAGWFNWTVDGVDQLAQSWMWFRTDGGAERSIDTLTQTGIRVLDLDGDPGMERLSVEYESANQFRMTLSYTLQGGNDGSGTSALPVGISIDNIGNQALDMSLFLYTDFDLAGTANDDSLMIENGNRAVQVSGQTTSEWLLTPRPSALEAAFHSTTLDSLNDGGPTVLNGQAGPLGAGNLTSTFFRSIQLDPNGSFVGSQVFGISVVPEPAAGTMLLVAMGALAYRRRRRA